MVDMVDTDIKGPDGKYYPMSHPANWTNTQIEAAAHEMFPTKKSTNQAPETREIKDIFGGPNGLEKAFLRYGIQDPLISLLNFGSRGAATANNLESALGEKIGSLLPEALQKKLPKAWPKEEPFNFSEMLGVPEAQKNWADSLSQFGGGIAPAVLAPEIPILEETLGAMRGGNYLSKALANAVPQGFLAGSQSPEHPGRAALEAAAIVSPFSAVSEGIKTGSPAIRNFSRALGALGAGALGYYGAKGIGAPESGADLTGLLAAALGARRGNLQRQLREDMLKGVEGTDYQDVLNAGERLGLTHIRPGEASANPFTAAAETSVGKSPKGAQLLYEAGQKRLGSEEKSIENLFENIFPKSLEERKNALYKTAESKEVPDTLLKEFHDNEIFKTALAHVKREPAYKEALKNVPENSIQYLNQVKEALDDMIEKAPTKEARIIRNTKNNFVGKLDEISPEYKEARQLAERGIVRKEIEKLFNKKDETGTNLFKTLLSNKRDYNDLQKKFKRLEETGSTPEQVESMKSAQQQLEDMKLVFERLITTPTAKTAATLARQNTTKEGNLTAMAKQFLHKLFHSDNYDVAAVKLITNPKWADEVEKLGEITKKDKLIAAFHNLLGKAGAQAIGQQ